MATATWNGGAGTWTKGGTNWSSAYAWQNQENTAATFAGTGGLVTVSGAVIAHSMTISSAGYTFNGGSVTVTAGGIQANQSGHDELRHLYRRPAGVERWPPAQTLTVNGPLHTIVSDLTFNGAGNTVIAGVIDGGGVLNTLGGAAPGNLIQAGTERLDAHGRFELCREHHRQLGCGHALSMPGSGLTSTYSGQSARRRIGRRQRRWISGS